MRTVRRRQGRRRAPDGRAGRGRRAVDHAPGRPFPSCRSPEAIRAESLGASGSSSSNGGAPRYGEPPWRRLLDVLREDLGLTGTKEGCGEGECGACTVLLDGEAVTRCLVPRGQMEGRTVIRSRRSLEGERGAAEVARSTRCARSSGGGAQCGTCTPGILLSQPRGAAAREPAADPGTRCCARWLAISAAAPATRGSFLRAVRGEGAV